MSLETRNLITVKEFGPELAGQRVGWSTVLGYGLRPDKVFGVHIATATIDEDGASIQYEPREKDGEEVKAYWSDAAKGFIAAAGVSVIIITDQDPDEAPRIGPYWSFEDDIVAGSSSGRILRVAGGAHNDEDELYATRVWAENPAETVANVKKSMTEAGIPDHYPTWYYTANMALAHESFRSGTGFGRLPVEAALLPDAGMQEATQAEIATARSMVEDLTDADETDATMLTNLTVFGNVPAKEIPPAFEASREKLYGIEQRLMETEKRLNTQVGIYLPVGCVRTWPYISADIKPSDGRAFGAELRHLREGDPGLAQSELKQERSELEYRKKHAAQGVAALQALARAEAELAQDV
jgi:hypothetical protein